MEAVILLSLVLAVVFVLSGSMKLLDVESSAKTFQGFGIPSRVSRIAVLVISVLEILLGLSVLVPETRSTGAASLAVTLIAFTAVLIRKIRQGVQISCACFGNLTSAPASWWTVIRNGTLFLITLALVFDESTSNLWDHLSANFPAIGLYQYVAIASLILSTLAVLLALYVINELREFIEHHVQVEEPKTVQIGQELFMKPILLSSSETKQSLEALTNTARTFFLVFVSPTCKYCESLLHRLENSNDRLKVSRERVAVIGIGNPIEFAQKSERYLAQQWSYDPKGDLALDIGLTGTPAVLKIEISRQATEPVKGQLFAGEPEALKALGFESEGGQLYHDQLPVDQ